MRRFLLWIPTRPVLAENVRGIRAGRAPPARRIRQRRPLPDRAASGPAPGPDVPGVDAVVDVGGEALETVLVAGDHRILEDRQERQIRTHDLLDPVVYGLALLRVHQFGALFEQLVDLGVVVDPGVLARATLRRGRGGHEVV